MLFGRTETRLEFIVGGKKENQNFSLIQTI